MAKRCVTRDDAVLASHIITCPLSACQGSGLLCHGRSEHEHVCSKTSQACGEQRVLCVPPQAVKNETARESEHFEGIDTGLVNTYRLSNIGGCWGPPQHSLHECQPARSACGVAGVGSLRTHQWGVQTSHNTNTMMPPPTRWRRTFFTSPVRVVALSHPLAWHVRPQRPCLTAVSACVRTLRTASQKAAPTTR